MENEAKKRVLVVEDEEDVSVYLSTLFADMGLEVETAQDGGEAMAAVLAKKPDLITLDIVMPEKTGVKFYRDIKGSPAHAEIPVIIITGLQKDFENFIHRRRSAPPPEGYVSKPFDKETLLAEVEKVLGVKLQKAAGA